MIKIELKSSVLKIVNEYYSLDFSTLIKSHCQLDTVFILFFNLFFFSSSKRCCFTVNDLILERIGSERSAWFQIQRPAVGMKIIINVLFLSRCFVTIRYE